MIKANGFLFPQYGMIRRKSNMAAAMMRSFLKSLKQEAKIIECSYTVLGALYRPQADHSWGPLKSEHRSFVIYSRNTDEQYGGYNLFQYAEFKANDSIKV